MAGLEKLIDEIADSLAGSVKAYNIPAVASAFGLTPGEESEAYGSKRVYVTKRLAGWSKERLVELAKKVQETYPSDSLQCMIEGFDSTQTSRIPNWTAPVSCVGQVNHGF